MPSATIPSDLDQRRTLESFIQYLTRCGPKTSAALEFKNRGENVSLLGCRHVRKERQPDDQLVDTLRHWTKAGTAAEFNAFRRQV